MIAAAIVLAILIVIALLRFGVCVEYSESGVAVTAYAGAISLKVLPRKEKQLSAAEEEKLKARREDKSRKKAAKKAVKKAEKDAEEHTRKESGEKKPGVLKPVLDMLPAAKKMLKRLRRRLYIKNLTIYYIVAGDDPSKTAMTYGAANAAVEVIVPMLEKSFRIKHRDFKVLCDFIETQQKIYINAAISMAVWEAVYTVLAVLPAVIGLLMSTKATKNRKDGHENGKNPHK